MARNHPAPPPNTLSPEKLQIGGEGTLVERFNLGELIRDRRMKGKSYRDITKEVNEGNFIPNGYKISHNSIARWCRDNGLGGDMTAPTDEQVVNVYGTKVKALNLVNNAVDIISVELDELDGKVGRGEVEVGELKLVIDMLDKMTLRQQTLSSEIGAIQEKVYRYETVEKAMNIIMDILRVKLSKSDYDEIMVAFRENPMLIEALKKIAPSNL